MVACTAPVSASDWRGDLEPGLMIERRWDIGQLFRDGPIDCARVPVTDEDGGIGW
jgi:hypothetical protein